MIITKENFETEVKQSSVPVLIDVWAEWCGPCRRMTPVVDDLAEEAEGKFKVGKIDAEANPELSEQLGVRSIPAFFVFENGEIKNRAVGMQTKDELLALIG
jgi:thioredoxin 1